MKEPFTALAFKIMTDPFVGRLAFFRVYSGKLDAGSYVLQYQNRQKNASPAFFKCTPINKTASMRSEAGDIGAAVVERYGQNREIPFAMKVIPIALESIKFPDPVIGLAIEPKTQSRRW